MEYEWGAWIEHDGKGCPVKGQFVHAKFSDADCFGATELFGRVPSNAGEAIDSPWVWHKAIRFGRPLLIRYCVRRPRVTEWLSEINVDLPERVDA